MIGLMSVGIGASGGGGSTLVGGGELGGEPPSESLSEPPFSEPAELLSVAFLCL